MWGFDIRIWLKHLNPLTWPEVLRQFALSAGFGPQLKKKIKVKRSSLPKMDEGKGCEDVITMLRNGSVAENATILLQEKGFQVAFQEVVREVLLSMLPFGALDQVLKISQRVEVNNREHTTAHAIAMTAAGEPAVVAANTAAQLDRFAAMSVDMKIKKVTSPYETILHHLENVTHGQLAFTLSESGRYLTCFSTDHHGQGGALIVNIDWNDWSCNKGLGVNSETTWKPKGVMLSHPTLVVQSHAKIAAITVYLHTAPLGYVSLDEAMDYILQCRCSISPKGSARNPLDLLIG